MADQGNTQNNYIEKSYKQLFKKNSFDKGISKLCYDLFEILYLTINKGKKDKKIIKIIFMFTYNTIPYELTKQFINEKICAAFLFTKEEALSLRIRPTRTAIFQLKQKFYTTDEILEADSKKDDIYFSYLGLENILIDNNDKLNIMDYYITIDSKTNIDEAILLKEEYVAHYFDSNIIYLFKVPDIFLQDAIKICNKDYMSLSKEYLDKITLFN